jgi:anti-sigma factor RsiW
MTNQDKTEEIRAYLPWYVNGTLDKGMAQTIESAVAASPALKKEVEWLQSLESKVKQDTEFRDIPENIGFEKFKALIDNEQSGKVTSISSRWQQWQRPLMAIAATLVVVQMGVIGMLLQSPQTGTSLTTLSGSTITINKGVLFQVTFAASATEHDIRHALNKVQGEIVAGPGAMGIYTILINTDNPINASKQLQTLPGVETINQLENE